MVGIYKITAPDGSVYIGQSWDIKRRFEQHKKSTNDRKSSLYKSFLYEGLRHHKFEIIHELPYDITEDVLNDYEKLYWKKYVDAGCIMLNSVAPADSRKFINYVYQYSKDNGKLIKEWNSVGDASRSLEIERGLIYRVLNGDSKQAGGFIWSRELKDVLTEYKYKEHIIKIN